MKFQYGSGRFLAHGSGIFVHNEWVIKIDRLTGQPTLYNLRVGYIQQLSNTQNYWLLINDNANDPFLDVSKFFQSAAEVPTLFITHNPDHKIHPTIGSCELGQMNTDDAGILVLKTTGVEDTAHKLELKELMPIARTIGL